MSGSRLFCFAIMVSSSLGSSPGNRLLAQVEWTLQGDGPVLTPEGAGWASVGEPTVLREADGLTLWCGAVSATQPYVSGIARFTSSDGLVWTPDPELILQGVPGTWKEWPYSPRVFHDPAAVPPYRMYFAGGHDNPFRCGIGLATSEDGKSWQEYEGNPVLAASQPWEQPCADSSSVLFDGTTYRMWYMAGTDDLRGVYIGIATSTDGLNWTKYPANPVLREGGAGVQVGAGPSCVLFDSATSSYEMWYTRIETAEGVGASIHYATSMDGIAWAKYSHNPVFSPGAWDELAVLPAVLFDGRKYSMWYLGGTEQRSTIGFATSPWSIPRASFTVSPSASLEPLSIALDASKSVTPNASMVEHTWDFGDGETLIAVGPQANHKYAHAGHYAVKLSVKDSTGAEGLVARGVDVTLPSCAVSPWISTDLGEPLFPGSSCLDVGSGCLRVSAGGKLLAGTSDQCHFVYQAISGDFTLSSRVADATGAESRWEIGVMVREGLDAEARHLSMVLHGEPASARFRSMRRAIPSGASSFKSGEAAASPDAWVRLERAGADLVASASTDGQAWTELQRLTLSDPPDVLFAGLVAAGRDARIDGQYDALDARVCAIELATPAPGTGPFVRGDCNGDGVATGSVSDAVFLLGFSFLGGTEPNCKVACDANADGGLDLSDAVYLLAHNFLGGLAPPAPFPDCSTSERPDDLLLGCDGPLSCP